MSDAQHLQNSKVFFGLGFPSFACVNNQECNIYSTHPRDHGANEIGVSWDINETQDCSRVSAHMSKPQINRHAFSLFFGKSVWVSASKCADE